MVRVLVVDDDLLTCQRLANGLAKAGFRTESASTCHRALAQADATVPDIAIVDLMMADGSGLDVVRHLKAKLDAAVHVIMVTGHDDQHHRLVSFDAGADDYLVKPVGLEEIRRRIVAVVRNQRELMYAVLAREASERRLVYGTEATALLAHDLNNGLAVALSNLSYLAESIRGDSDEADAISTTLRSVRRMAGLVANFVDIARFEDAAIKPKIQRSRVLGVLQDVTNVNGPSLARGVTLAVDCAPELEARFDASLVERVLHNLFGNAMRYCNKDGVITLSGKRWNDGDSIEISVSNTGPQIPEDIRPCLFGKYVQGKGGKRGMGLYFCRLVAEAHGGLIEYEVRPQGPSFVLRLPGT